MTQGLFLNLFTLITNLNMVSHFLIETISILNSGSFLMQVTWLDIKLIYHERIANNVNTSMHSLIWKKFDEARFHTLLTV